MYNEFFGFEGNPFGSKPDLAFFYRSTQHDTSLRSLMFAVQARMGLSALTGEEGTGKTILLECLRDTLESAQIQCAFLRDSRISTARFFQTIASELDLKCQGTSAYQVFSALHQLTIQQAKKGRTVALIVDEAHNLSAEVLNEILHLASLHDDKVKLLQTVIAGRPELHPTLDALNLERLKQHAIVSCNLQPFTASETKDYIEFRLAQAGLPEQEIFSPEAIDEVYDRSRGFAPAIHALCEGLLLAAFSEHSKVCTQEILDQVFNRSQNVEPAATVVAVTRIDLTRLAASDPEPPPMKTAGLRLAFDALPGLPPPLPVIANELSDFQLIALQCVLPPRVAELPDAKVAVGSNKLFRLAFDAIKILPPPLPVSTDEVLEQQRTALQPVLPALASSLRAVRLGVGSKTPMRPAAKVFATSDPRVHPLPGSSIVSKPVLSKPVVLAEPRPTGKLQRLRQNTPAHVAPQSAVLATAIDFTSIALPTSHSAIESLSNVLLTLRGVNRLALLPWSANNVQAAATGLRNLPLTAIHFTESQVCRPEASNACPAGALQIPASKRIPLDRYVRSTPLAGAPGGAHSFEIHHALHPMCPGANLQPLGTIKSPRVPLTPFALPKHDPPSIRTSGDVLTHSVSIEAPTKPAIADDLAASRVPNVQARKNLLSLACNVPPSQPPAAMPIKKSLNALPSLQPWHPASNLEPVNPRSTFLLLPSWTPQTTNPVTTVDDAYMEAAKPFSINPKWLLTLALPILAGAALYGSPRAMRTAADTVSQGWQRAHQVMLDRAAVALDEDFRAGLDNWTTRGGAAPAWTSDAAGFAHPGALALYRPSLGLTDYQMQFVGTIDKKGLSWAVRAADFNNYYAVRLTVLKPGPTPSIGVTRYAVINGKTQNQVTTPLVMSARSDTVYRVSLDIHGDRYALSVQDQPVDFWSEPKLRHGGIGFFSEHDAGSRVAGVQVRGQYDMLGRLCAVLAPSGIYPYRAALNQHAAITD